MAAVASMNREAARAESDRVFHLNDLVERRRSKRKTLLGEEDRRGVREKKCKYLDAVAKCEALDAQQRCEQRPPDDGLDDDPAVCANAFDTKDAPSGYSIEWPQLLQDDDDLPAPFKAMWPATNRDQLPADIFQPFAYGLHLLPKVPGSVLRTYFAACTNGPPAAAAAAASATRRLLLGCGSAHGFTGGHTAAAADTCVPAWLPSDSDILQALVDFGYKVGLASDAPVAATTADGAAEAAHPRVHHLEALATWVEAASHRLQLVQQQEQNWRSTATASQPPAAVQACSRHPFTFGESPDVAAALCRAAVDPAMAPAQAAVRAALGAYLEAADGEAFARQLRAAGARALAGMPTVHVAVAACQGLTGWGRAALLRQELAAAALARQLSLEVSDARPPLAALRPIIDDVPFLLAAARPAAAAGDGALDAEPDAWLVYAMCRLLHFVAHPWLEEHLEGALMGAAVDDDVAAGLVAVKKALRGLQCGLKSRKHVAVYHTRLLCDTLLPFYDDTAAVAEALLTGSQAMDMLSQ